jgi:hypothetical protein
MKHPVSIGLAALMLAVVAMPIAAQTLNITADPATATIYKLKVQDNSLVAIGVGNAKLKLDSKDPNTIVVRQEGYREVRHSFPTDEKYKDKSYTIFLNTRVVQLTALPYDASILVNGEVKGQRTLEVEVLEGQTTSVEVNKRGFASVRRVYRWEKGGELPPAQDRVELVDRKVLVTASPSGVELVSNDTKIGEGDGEFVIKRGTCGTLMARKAGWIPVEREWCNKDGLPEPPIADRLALAGRVVNVTAPPGARIFVNQKQAGTGAFAVNVADGACVKVRVEQTGFITYNREYCVQTNAPAPPQEDSVTLKQDDSIAASVASDQANVNVTLEIGAAYNEAQAWKLLASIVLSHFDVLENSDSQTGYLRTAWQIKTWGESNEVAIRTRIIVKRSNDSPLRYTLKIVSEHNKAPGVSVKEDENFAPWDRLLNTYKDVISEVQSRLR